MTLATQDLSRAMGADAVARVVEGPGLGHNHMNFLIDVNAGGVLFRWLVEQGYDVSQWLHATHGRPRAVGSGATMLDNPPGWSDQQFAHSNEENRCSISTKYDST